MPLYIHKTKKACFVRLRGVHMPIHLDAPICLDAPCMFDTPYVWMAPCIFGYPHMPPCTFGHPLFGWPLCLDDVWMALYIHKHKESMLCETRGVHMPHTFGCPPVCLDAAICLDGPCMFGCPHMFGNPPYI